jgi:hypothetical protein
MKKYEGVAVQIHIFLTSTLVTEGCSTLHPHQGKNSWYALGTMLCEPQNQSGGYEEENIHDLARTQTLNPR